MKKKILAIVMTVCMMASVLCVTAFAADEPAADIVLRVSGLKKENSEIVKIDDYKSFEDGWNFAMEKAEKRQYLDDNGYDRIVVELLTDWNANEKGEFGDSDGVGFRQSTIYVPDGARVMLNMNGHTIDRGLGDRNELDGEVICIEEDADVIINGGKNGDTIARADAENATVKFGTITGGNSDNGAGGIHIQDDARVMLNNVIVKENVADGDDGAGIAMYDGATLVMSGGGFIGNENNTFGEGLGGAIYIEDSAASFDNVLFKGNQFTYSAGSGAALYCYNSSAMLNKCKLVDNGKKNDDNGTAGAHSIIKIEDAEMIIKDTDFIGNGNATTFSDASVSCLIESDMYISSSYLSIDNATFSQNNVVYILELSNQDITVNNSRFTDNHSNVLNCTSNSKSVFTDCVFNNNTGMHWGGYYTINVTYNDVGPSFINCDMGDSTFNDRNRVIIENGAVGSIFGEGSLTAIVAILALAASVVSVCLSVAFRKKKALPETANNASEDQKDEES